MAQDQILNLLKETPKKKYDVYDIMYSIPGGLSRRITHKNLKRLEKLDCIHKEKGEWYYVERKN